MKIKAKEIQPGMVIGIDRGDNYGDISLVIATKGFVSVEYTHFNYIDSYGGAMIGTIDGKTKVKVITGKKRDKVIKSVKNDLFRNRQDVEKDIEMIWLIQAMDKQNG